MPWKELEMLENSFFFISASFLKADMRVRNYQLKIFMKVGIQRNENRILKLF